MLGTDAFQESDITGITLPITKHNYLIKESPSCPQVIQGGVPYRHDRTSRARCSSTSPSTSARASWTSSGPRQCNLPGYKPTYQGPQPGRSSRRPRYIAPRAPAACSMRAAACSSSGAAKELKELAELMQLPVVTTLMGKGAFPEDHHLCIGMPGMHGAKYTNYTITETDLLIAVGVRFDDRVTGKLSAFASKAKIIHVDIDPAEIGKNKAVDVPIVGDAKPVLAGLVAELRKTGAEPKTEAWMHAIDDWRKQFPLHFTASERGASCPQAVVQTIDRLTAGPQARHLHRGRPEPDVGVPVHAHHRAAHVGVVGRPGHDGLRPAGRHGRQARHARPPRHRHRR